MFSYNGNSNEQPQRKLEVSKECLLHLTSTVQHSLQLSTGSLRKQFSILKLTHCGGSFMKFHFGGENIVLVWRVGLN